MTAKLKSEEMDDEILHQNSFEPSVSISASEYDNTVMCSKNDENDLGRNSGRTELGTSPISSQQGGRDVPPFNFEVLDEYKEAKKEGPKHLMVNVTGIAFNSPLFDNRNNQISLTTPSSCSTALPPAAPTEAVSMHERSSDFEPALPPLLDHPLPPMIQAFDLNSTKENPTKEPENSQNNFLISAPNHALLATQSDGEVMASLNNVSTGLEKSEIQQDPERSLAVNDQKNMKQVQKRINKSSKNGIRAGDQHTVSKRPKRVNKRKIAKQKMQQEMKIGAQLAQLAREKKITDEELLQQRPKKLRRPARFVNASPSRFCHICSRTPKSVRLAVCQRIRIGLCRKVVCEKCFTAFQLGDFESASDPSKLNWLCSHCTGKCPQRAQCGTYGKINERLRLERLKQPRVEEDHNGINDVENVDDLNEEQKDLVLEATLQTNDNENDRVLSSELHEQQAGLAKKQQKSDTSIDNNAKHLENYNVFQQSEIQPQSELSSRSSPVAVNNQHHFSKDVHMDFLNYVNVHETHVSGTNQALPRSQISGSQPAIQLCKRLSSPLKTLRSTSSQMTLEVPTDNQNVISSRKIISEDREKDDVVEIDMTGTADRWTKSVPRPLVTFVQPSAANDGGFAFADSKSEELSEQNHIRTEELLAYPCELLPSKDSEERVLDFLCSKQPTANTNQFEYQGEDTTPGLRDEPDDDDKKWTERAESSCEPRVDWDFGGEIDTAVIATFKYGSDLATSVKSSEKAVSTVEGPRPILSEMENSTLMPVHREEDCTEDAQADHEERVKRQVLEWCGNDIDPYLFTQNAENRSRNSSFYLEDNNYSAEDKVDESEVDEKLQVDREEHEKELVEAVEADIENSLEIKDTLRLLFENDREPHSPLDPICEMMEEAEKAEEHI